MQRWVRSSPVYRSEVADIVWLYFRIGFWSAFLLRLRINTYFPLSDVWLRPFDQTTPTNIAGTCRVERIE
ncbi:hypothetical protein PLICRDRAFT_35744 [Plicaturopsis crispa FD-325 SS-3]|nr:hypothetical protein PLICRDRAFT_35744 [Plicaturopsis crispa FD-325 SS-3]